MKNLNLKLTIGIPAAAIIAMLLGCVSFSQENDGKYGFIAIFKDTVLELSQMSEKELVLHISEDDIRRIIKEDSVISLNSSRDTIWTFDFAIDGRRCYGTAFSGPVITKTIMKEHSSNIIFLYSALNALDSRLLKGMLIYISDKNSWQLKVKTE